MRLDLRHLLAHSSLIEVMPTETLAAVVLLVSGNPRFPRPPELEVILASFRPAYKTKVRFGQLPAPQSVRTSSEGLICPFSLEFVCAPVWIISQAQQRITLKAPACCWRATKSPTLSYRSGQFYQVLDTFLKQIDGQVSDSRRPHYLGFRSFLSTEELTALDESDTRIVSCNRAAAIRQLM